MKWKPLTYYQAIPFISSLCLCFGFTAPIFHFTIFLAITRNFNHFIFISYSNNIEGQPLVDFPGASHFQLIKLKNIIFDLNAMLSSFLQSPRKASVSMEDFGIWLFSSVTVYKCRVLMLCWFGRLHIQQCPTKVQQCWDLLWKMLRWFGLGLTKRFTPVWFIYFYQVV